MATGGPVTLFQIRHRLERSIGPMRGSLNLTGPPSSRHQPGLPLFLQPKLAISQPWDPAEQEADRVADQVMRMPAPELTHVVQQNPMVLRYRNPTSPATFNFGTADEGDLVEDSFHVNQDKETKPWIELITVTLTDKVVTPDNEDFWIGEGTAKYYDNSVKRSDMSLTLSGGPVGRGKTKRGTFTVKRIEGVGYMSSKYSEAYEPAAKEGKGRRYEKNMNGNMNFAVFFYGGQALHSGPADSGSHGCVHVDWDDEKKMKQLNYHSVVGLTKVKVQYS